MTMIPRTLFGEEHQLFRDSFRKFLEAEVAPHHNRWEDQGYVDRDIWLKAGTQGVLAPNVPENYGGLGLDYRYNVIVDEELSHAGFSGPGWSMHSNIAVPYITRYGSAAAKDRFLPACVSGEMIAGIAMTEPGTGSDLQSVKTTARKEGSHYILNGSKTFITNGLLGDLIIVVAKTNPKAGAAGTSLFLVEADSPGFSKGKSLKKLGMRGNDTAELYFEEVRVPEENLLGAENAGFMLLMKELPQERLTIATCNMAGCESLLEQTLHYVKERTAFGRPVSAFQNTQFKLAELSAEITAMRVFTDRCIELHLQNRLDPVTASKAKLLISELLGKVSDECLQLHGGYGYMWEYPIARAYADARVQRIYGGTSEIMKLIIGRSLLA